ncbi:hypothetical protein [Piscinibacter sakaiensis]|uniref:hypothetical protein n=1 Tax=Piscinibacter sakaiensis TaxID=1547922 RepID=UPI003AAA4312
MDRIKPLGWPSAEAPHHPPRHARLVAAWALRAASVMLDKLAQRLAAADESSASKHHLQIEFHAESGAPEGALYVDGRLVGWLDGVRRL